MKRMCLGTLLLAILVIIWTIQPAVALSSETHDLTLTLQGHEATNELFTDWFGPSPSQDEIRLQITLSNPSPSVSPGEPRLLIRGHGVLGVGSRSFPFTVSGYVALHETGLVVGPLRGTIQSTEGPKPLLIGYMGRPGMRPDGLSVTIGTADESNSVLTLDFGSYGPYQAYFGRSQAKAHSSEKPLAPRNLTSSSVEEVPVSIQSAGGINYHGVSIRAYCGYNIGYLISYGEEGLTNGTSNIQTLRWLSDTSNMDAAWESCFSETVLSVKVKEARYGIHMPQFWDRINLEPEDNVTSITVYFYVPGPIGLIDYTYTTSRTTATYYDGESDGYRNVAEWEQWSSSGFDPSVTDLQGSYGNDSSHDDSHGFYGRFKTDYHGSSTTTEYGNKWAEFTYEIHAINWSGYHIDYLDTTRVYHDFTVKTY